MISDAAGQSGWASLFDGKAVDNRDKVGDADWRIVDGATLTVILNGQKTVDGLKDGKFPAGPRRVLVVIGVLVIGHGDEEDPRRGSDPRRRGRDREWLRRRERGRCGQGIRRRRRARLELLARAVPGGAELRVLGAPAVGAAPANAGCLRSLDHRLAGREARDEVGLERPPLLD